MSKREHGCIPVRNKIETIVLFVKPKKGNGTMMTTKWLPSPPRFYSICVRIASNRKTASKTKFIDYIIYTWRPSSRIVVDVSRAASSLYWSLDRKYPAVQRKKSRENDHWLWKWIIDKYIQWLFIAFFTRISLNCANLFGVLAKGIQFL